MSTIQEMMSIVKTGVPHPQEGALAVYIAESLLSRSDDDAMWRSFSRGDVGVLCNTLRRNGRAGLAHDLAERHDSHDDLLPLPTDVPGVLYVGLRRYITTGIVTSTALGSFRSYHEALRYWDDLSQYFPANSESLGVREYALIP